MAVVLALVAIAVWSSLALIGSSLEDVPPLFSVGVSLCVGGLVGLFRFRDWKVPLPTLAVGVGGIFGYHVLLFTAFKLAPAVEVNILNYLWPLLIVLLSPLFLPGSRLGTRHVIGALLGLAGAVLTASGGRLGFETASLPGYLLAAAAAFVWAAYSLLTKRLPPFPTGAVGLFCLVSGALSLQLFFGGGAIGSVQAEGSWRVVRFSAREWLGMAALGLGPMGGAFYAWDAALKRGDPRVIGSLAYLTPLLSTLNLVVFGGKNLGASSGLAILLIVGGALLGSWEVVKAALGRARRAGAR
jgi:drug/metabolite transporter (DMT)-like permease